MASRFGALPTQNGNTTQPRSLKKTASGGTWKGLFWKWASKGTEAARKRRKEYGGGVAFTIQGRYTRPMKLEEIEKALAAGSASDVENQKAQYMNSLGQIIAKYEVSALISENKHSTPKQADAHCRTWRHT